MRKKYGSHVLKLLNKFRQGQNVSLSNRSAEADCFFSDTAEEIPNLLAPVEFVFTKRETVVDCLRQKVLGNLFLCITKANEEGARLLNKYDNVSEHFIHKLARKK